MATENDVARSRRLTLSTTDVDILNFSQPWHTYVITNEDDTEILTVTTDGTTPTAGGDDMYYVPPSSSLEVPSDSNVAQVQVIGNGNIYSVVGK